MTKILENGCVKNMSFVSLYVCHIFLVEVDVLVSKDRPGRTLKWSEKPKDAVLMQRLPQALSVLSVSRRHD